MSKLQKSNWHRTLHIFYRLCFVLLFLPLTTLAQEDDMMDLFADEEPTTDYTFATFKTTRVVIGQSIENPANGNLIFDIQHRFGTLNTGFKEFFGLDQATTRLGFQYGIFDWFAIGIGRSTLEKTYDASLKFKILRQSTGAKKMPVSLSYFCNLGINSLEWAEPERENYFSSRLSYTHQLLVARKISRGVSLQLMPTFVHFNLVEKASDDNDVFSLGAAGRFKLSNRISLNLEYYYLISQQTRKDYQDSFSIGIDIETGGHVFQLHMTNSAGIIEQHFVPRTTGKWFEGDIHIGFNISRAFVLKKPKEFRE